VVDLALHSSTASSGIFMETFSTFFPRYNIAPSQDVPVILRNEDRNELRPMRWGLVPSWAQDPSIGQRMINARAETLLEKPSFKQLVALPSSR
jgi:putative SOS response-associated peptidase YedK